jgi:hypothetical protein
MHRRTGKELLAHGEPTQNFENQQLQEPQAIVGAKIRRA